MAKECVALAVVLLWCALPFTGADGEASVAGVQDSTCPTNVAASVLQQAVLCQGFERKKGIFVLSTSYCVDRFTKRVRHL